MTGFNRDWFSRGTFNSFPTPDFALYIGGVDRTGLLDLDSLQISDVLGSRNSAAFALTDIGGASRPWVGQNVTIISGTISGTQLEFAGTIDDLDEHEIEGHWETTLVYEVECVDYCQIADRHTVAKLYTGETLGDIARDIVATALAGEGVGVTYVEDGPTIERAVFNYATAAEAFDELCRITGYSWYIDYTKDLHLFSRETNACPIALTDTSQNYKNMKVHRTRERYRNVQYIRAGKDVSAERTETFVGDGTVKTFVLTLPVAKAPTVTLNTGAQTAGIRQIDSGKHWYWSKDEREITQDDSGTAIGAGDTLAVTYQGLFPILVRISSEDEVTARLTIEGGSGIYEAIESDTNIDERAMAIGLGNALLRRFGSILGSVTFSTDEEGIRAGQLISIASTPHNLSGDYLIQSVKTSVLKKGGGEIFRSTVTALSGEAVGGWITFFADLLRKTEKFVIRENEVLILLRTLRDAVICSDELSVSSGAPETRVGYAQVGYSEVG